MPGPKRSIVIIDDDPDDLFFATRCITKTGHVTPVLAFADSVRAIAEFESAARLGSCPACVVFCDLKMPGASGFEVIQALRQLPNCRELPIYVLSGSPLDADKSRALALGATGYLVKFPAVDVFGNAITAACS